MTKKYYGVFNPQGVPQGFYPDDIYTPKEDGSRNAAIPGAAVEITEAQWTELLSGQPLARFVGGAVTHVAPPPPPPDPPNPTLLEAQRANARLDAGVLAALDVAIAVKGAMTALPDNFTAANFIAVKIQLDALTELVASMLQAQVSIPPPGAKPP